MWPVLLPQVLPCPQLIFLPKPGFLEFIWIFNGRNHLKIKISHILNPNLTKSILLDPAHQDLSNNTKGSEIFSDEIIQYSRTFAPQVERSWNQAPPSRELSKRFQRHHQEHDLRHPGPVDLVPTKQNKQTTFLHR